MRRYVVHLLINIAAGALATFIAAEGHAQSSASVRVGQAVDIQWPVNGEPRWIPATVTELGTSSVRARFRSADAGMYSSTGEMNEWMPREKVRARGNGSVTMQTAANAQAQTGEGERLAPPAAASWRVGSEVDAYWSGEWYPARVLAVRPGEVRVRYDGHSERFDEWVRVSGIRARTATRQPARTVGAGTPPPRIPSGVYRCTENVARYTGSTYNPSTGSTPRYSYSPQSRGTLTLEGGRYRAASGGMHPFQYDPASGRIRWMSGVFAGTEFNGGRAETDAQTGRVRVLVQLRTTRPSFWNCVPS